MNPLLLTDGYKVDHRRQYPDGTTLVYSNWTPRKSRLEEVDEVVFLDCSISSKNILFMILSTTFLNSQKKKWLKNTLAESIII